MNPTIKKDLFLLSIIILATGITLPFSISHFILAVFGVTVAYMMGLVRGQAELGG